MTRVTSRARRRSVAHAGHRTVSRTMPGPWWCASSSFDDLGDVEVADTVGSVLFLVHG